MFLNDILTRHDIQEIEKRFKRKLAPGGPDDCWEWTGQRDRGYGNVVFGRAKRSLRAHRLAYVLHNGMIPEYLNGMLACVLHRCDNPPCCNPKHLFLGTNTDNIDDMMRKNRQNKGENSGRAKLTDENVLAIRAATKDIGKLHTVYGVSPGTIMMVRSGNSWKHLPLDRAEVVPTRRVLTADQIPALRADRRKRSIVAAEYGISIRHLADIRNGKEWKRIPMEKEPK